MSIVADCHVTASSISATETLNPCRNWSLSERTTCRRSFRDCACSIRISSLSCATAIASKSYSPSVSRIHIARPIFFSEISASNFTFSTEPPPTDSRAPRALKIFLRNFAYNFPSSAHNRYRSKNAGSPPSLLPRNSRPLWPPDGRLIITEAPCPILVTVSS